MSWRGVRTWKRKPSQGKGLGASLGPAPRSPPCPTVPWQVQHWYFMLAFCPATASCEIPLTGKSSNEEKNSALTSTALRHDVDQRRLAALHHGERALERRPDVRGLRDWPFGPHALRLRELGVVDVGRLDHRADL